MKAPEVGRPKKTKKINPLAFVLTLFSSIFVGMLAATQIFAHNVSHHASLGANIGHIYPPWQIFFWFSNWSSEERLQAFFGKALYAGLGTFAICFFIGILIICRKDTKGVKDLHGSARWATEAEIRKAELLGDEGVFVGAWRDKSGKKHYLRHNGPEHILNYAPTRSGKGVGLIIPTLLTWMNSAVITDLKGELWAITAGWRKNYAKQAVIKFEPAALESAAWSPLDEIRLGTEYEVGDVQNLATLIVDPDGKGLNDHWSKTAFALLTGCILHLLYKREMEGTMANMSALDAMLADSSRPISELWVEMVSTLHVEGETHPTIARAAQDMLDRPEEEAGSVLSTAKSFLALYRDPVVAKNTAYSSFKVNDIMNHNTPVSVYIVTQPSDKDRLKPLVRIFVNMTVRMLTAKMDFIGGEGQAKRAKSPHKHRLLLMLDEFPSLGKLELIQEALAFIAGYGIKAYLICQDITQLRNPQTGYGHDELISSNCHIQNAYPTIRQETAKFISDMTGETTIIKEQISRSGSGLLAKQSKNISYSEVKRPLLTPDEIKTMPGPEKDSHGNITKAGEMLIFFSGLPPIYGEQPLYFQDEMLSARSAVEPPKESDILRENQNISIEL